jgi:hypothetical protein
MCLLPHTAEGRAKIAVIFLAHIEEAQSTVIEVGLAIM